MPAGLSVGRHTYGMGGVKVHGYHGSMSARVGAFCSLADCTFFLSAGHHTEWVSTFPFGAFEPFASEQNMTVIKGDIVVGNDVWISSGATIMPGVTIGDGAVVAANSHVVRDVPPYAIVGGNPARVIKMRFPDDVVRRLLELHWWDLSDELLCELAPLLCSADVDRFLDTAKSRLQ